MPVRLQLCRVRERPVHATGSAAAPRAPRSSLQRARSPEARRREIDVRRAEGLFEAMELRGPRDGHDPWLLGEKPGNRHLGRCGALRFRDSGLTASDALVPEMIAGLTHEPPTTVSGAALGSHPAAARAPAATRIAAGRVGRATATACQPPTICKPAVCLSLGHGTCRHPLSAVG